ncbi:MAG: beta-ketoacyl-[acyl-carrier-protein] synthase family protein [Candidatus Omnitrophica bacterium]|nr:beta-ketoacyl-[acyl-carrier-protein] synthase family protein [Candidatus Omnitrophota bacterium]
MKKRVVITGLGAVTALGEGAEPLWDAVLANRSGIGVLDLGAGWKPLGAVLKNFDGEKYVVQKKSLKVMARDIQLAVAAASLAVRDSNLEVPAAARDRFGVIVGCGVLNHELEELAPSIQNAVGPNGKVDLKKFGEDGISSLFPLWLLKYLPNMPACHISILFDLQGPNNTLTTGASSGLQAVGEAFRIIQRGSADLMLAGGAESKVNPVGLTQYEILGVLSQPSGADPSTVYRPLDAEGKGFVAGEGAGFLLLEELEHARKRKAKIYAEITGFGSSSNRGRKTAVEAALHDAAILPKALNYVQASGLGLEEEDLLEADALEGLVNGSARELSVSGSKAVTGFTGFASGALDLILSSLALKHQTIPPTLNFKKPRRPWKFSVVCDKPLKVKIENALTNAFGLNSPSVSVVTRTVKES